MLKNKTSFVIVDDDQLNNLVCRMTIEMVLGRCQIVTFSDGFRALDFMKSDPSGSEYILFLDINMPLMSGWDFLMSFEQLETEIKSRYHIYLLSSSVDERDKQRGQENRNVVSFISKPLTRQALENILVKNDQ